MSIKITEFEKNIGYKFKNISLLENALTHSSYANEHHIKNNERLEFLGDSVLSIIMSDYLYKKMSDVAEGDLSKMRASIVCEQSLNDVARRIDLHNALRIGVGEERTGGRNRASIVADAFEAVLAAMYLDSDIETVSEWLLNLMRDDILETIKGKRYDDYKTKLQEKLQKLHAGKISYKIIKEVGQDHNKVFTAKVMLDGKKLGIGEGNNKKEAEQHAAKMALEKLR